MASRKEDSLYLDHVRHSIESIDLDLEDHDNDSETTLASDSFLAKQDPLSTNYTIRSQQVLKAQRLSSILTWMRWSIVVLLQGVIIMLLVPASGVLGDGWSLRGSNGNGGWEMSMTETGGDVNGIYIPKSHKYTLLTPEEEKFIPNMTSDVNRMDVRKNWDMLMPLGSGTVEILDWQQHPLLGLPVNDDPIRNGSIYEASWTHALHCLYYTVDSYHQLASSNGTKFGFDGERNDYHASHCFEYLRNQILCMADMTMEGSASALAVEKGADGQAHMCRDRDEAKEWIEARRVDDLQSIVGPSMDASGLRR